MKENYLLPFISAIDSDYSLSTKKKNILCFVLAAMQTNSDGMALAQLNSLAKVSRDRLYKILAELEKDGFIIRAKKGRCMYIAVNLDRIAELSTKQDTEKQLMSQILKLRLSSNKS